MSRRTRRNRRPVAPPAAVPVGAPAWASRLTPDQIRTLLAPINPVRVLYRADGLPYLQWWDVDRWLTRIFGLANWSREVRHLALADRIEIPARPGHEDQRTRYVVVYEATIRLTVCALDGTPLAHYDGESGYASDPVTLEQLGQTMVDARKAAGSLGLTRAALHLGDQFGLSLRTDPDRIFDALVVGTMQAGHRGHELPAPDAPSEVVPPDRPGRHRAPDPDVVAILAGVDTMDQTQVAAVAARVERAGLGGAYAGRMARGDGDGDQAVTVAQVLARRLAAIQARPPVHIPLGTAGAGAPVGDLAAGQGTWPCGCPTAAVALAGGRHPDTCRDRLVSITLNGAGS